MWKKSNSIHRLVIMIFASSLLITSMLQLSFANQLPLWNSDSVYWGGDEVEHNGEVYIAKWWTKGDIPNEEVENEWDTPWQLKDGNGDENDNADNSDGNMSDDSDEIPRWQPYTAYLAGDEIEYDGEIYMAKWWTKGDIPNEEVENEWDTPWQLKNENSGGSNEGDNNTSEDNTVDSSDQTSKWQSDTAYLAGDEVEYSGEIYVAKWWTRGDIPNEEVTNKWDTPWQLKSDITKPDENDGSKEDNSNTPETENPINNSRVIYPDYSNVDVGQGVKWPKTVFAPYVDSTLWPKFPLAEKSKDLKLPYFNLGFIVSQSIDVCKPTWGTYYSAEEGPLNDDIKRIREMGGDITVSFGGAANVPLHAAAPDAESLKEQYKRFIKAYGLTRVDFDIEGSWIGDTDSLKRNSEALKGLQDELKSENYDLEIWFTLPVLPSGLTYDGINLIKLALDENLDIAGVNVMTMNYGSWNAPNPSNQMGEYGIKAISSLKEQLEDIYSSYNIPKTEAELWSMIGTTPMLGLNDITTEIFNLQDARETIEFAIDKQIGMISMWSINRDKSINGNINYLSNHESSIAQEDYGFTKIFNSYNDISILDIIDDEKVGSEDGEASDSGKWDSSSIYTKGSIVTHKGHVYEAKWWTSGDDPSKEVYNEWDTPWKLIK